MKPGLLMLPSAVSNSRVHNILPNKIETDFQFSRASAATRVNHQGLIEEVGYFSDELVQNGDFSELGPELVTNGDFATDSNWTKQTGWSIINGKAVAENAGNPTASVLAQAGYSLVIGKTYKVVYTVSDYVKGQVRPQFIGGGTSNLPNVSANGTYIEYFVAVNNSTTFRFRAATTDGGFTGKIDNVSVKQVDPNNRWSVGVGWDITDKANFNDTVTSAIYQSGLTLTSGKKYKLTFIISDSSGNTSIWIGNSAGGVNYEGGTYRAFANGNNTIVFNMPSDQTTLAFYGNTSGVSFSIDNISLVEVIGDKPRLNYDPINPTCPHLLLEPQSTNLLPFSENFSDYTFNGSISILSNNNTSPSNSLNASLISITDTNPNTKIQKSTSVISGNTYTFSVFLKSDSNLTLEIGGIASAHITVNTTNKWQRFSVTQVASANTRYPQVKSSGTQGTFYMWGAQLEELSYPTSYIPTAGATQTRIGETCTSAGNANTFNSTEGVLYAEIAALADDLTFRSISINNGTSNEAAIIRFRTNSNRINGLIRDGGSAVNNLNFDVTDITDFHKVAYKFKTGDCALFIDGSQVATGTSAFTLSPLINLNFNNGLGDFFYGKTKNLATYNRALTDNELYTITSTQYSAYSGMVAALGNYTIPC